MTSAIIFDCDGVLVDSEILAQEVERAVLGEIGLHYDAHDFTVRFMGRSDKAFYALLEADGRERLGRSIEHEIRGPMGALYKEAIDTRLAEVPGALRAVAAVRHVKAVASSSTGPHLEKKLRRTQLWDHFAPHVYSADHVEHSKPAPDLFLHAAKALGVDPVQCLVIEDSVNGVLAARAAGMRVWGFLGGGHMSPRMAVPLAEAGAERIVKDWAEAEFLFNTL